MIKIYKSDVSKIPTMSLLAVYRRSLKIIKFYPSIKKEEMKQEMIIDYHEKKDLKDEKQIKEAVTIAHNFLRHLYTYEAARRQLIEEPFYEDEEEELKYKNNIIGNKKYNENGLFTKTKMIKLDPKLNIHSLQTENQANSVKEKAKDEEKYESF